MTPDIEAVLRAVPFKRVCERAHEHARDDCFAPDYPALAQAVRELMEQCTETTQDAIVVSEGRLREERDYALTAIIRMSNEISSLKVSRDDLRAEVEKSTKDLRELRAQQKEDYDRAGKWERRAVAYSQEITRLAGERDRLRDLYADMVNQFALYFTKDGVELVGTGSLSDLEAAFAFFALSDPCKLGEFRAALAPPAGAA